MIEKYAFAVYFSRKDIWRSGKKMLLLQFNGPHCQMVSKNLRTEWLI